MTLQLPPAPPEAEREYNHISPETFDEFFRSLNRVMELIGEWERLQQKAERLSR